MKCKHCSAIIPDYVPYSQNATCCAARWYDRQASVDRAVKLAAEKRIYEPEDDSDYGDWIYEQAKDKKADCNG